MTAPHSPSLLRVAVIIGSTREGRFGPTVARWIAAEAQAHGGFEVDLLDLADTGLPAVHPRHADAAVAAYRDRLERADAFVVVTPEYNHGYPASLKHAVDLAGHQWHAKPVGFVSYGGISGGLRAVEQLRQVFAELHAVGVRDTVSFHGARDRFGDDGRPVDAVGPRAAAKTMLDQLAWWGQALRDARTDHPYAA